MTKEDLRSGMIVKLRNGKSGVIYLNSPNGDIIGHGGLSNPTWYPLNEVNSDLTDKGVRECDIIVIYSPMTNSETGDIEATLRNCIWRREEILELTIDEIAKKFNVPVNTIKIKK